MLRHSGKNCYYNIFIISSYSLATCKYLLFKQLLHDRLLSVPVQPSQLQAAGQPLPGGGHSLPGADHHVSGAGHSYPGVGQQPVVGSGQQVTRMEEGGFSSQFGLTEKLDDLDEIEMVRQYSPPRLSHPFFKIIFSTFKKKCLQGSYFFESVCYQLSLV